MRIMMHACGVEVTLPLSPAWQLVPVDARQINDHFPPHLLILGPDALRVVHPGRAESWLRAGRRVLLICGEQFSGDVLPRWLELAAGRMVRPAQLSARLEEDALRLRGDLVRWPMKPSAWLRAKPRGTHAKFALEVAVALEHVHPVYDVMQLAQVSGKSYSTLHRRLRSALDCTPRELYLRYVAKQLAVSRRMKRPTSACALSLGYSDASALAHALGKPSASRLRLLPSPPAMPTRSTATRRLLGT